MKSLSRLSSLAMLALTAGAVWFAITEYWASRPVIAPAAAVQVTLSDRIVEDLR